MLMRFFFIFCFICFVFNEGDINKVTIAIADEDVGTIEEAVEGVIEGAVAIDAGAEAGAAVKVPELRSPVRFGSNQPGNLIFIQDPKATQENLAAIVRRIADRYHLQGTQSAEWITSEPMVYAAPTFHQLINNAMKQLLQPTFKIAMIRDPTAALIQWLVAQNLTTSSPPEEVIDAINIYPPGMQFKYISPSPLLTAIDVVDIYSFVAVADRFKESVLVLTAMLNITICDVLHLNYEEKQAYPSLKQFHHSIQEVVYSEGYRSRHALDYSLYDTAFNRLDELISSLGVGFNSALRRLERIQWLVSDSHCPLIYERTQCPDGGMFLCGRDCLDNACKDNSTTAPYPFGDIDLRPRPRHRHYQQHHHQQHHQLVPINPDASQFQLPKPTEAYTYLSCFSIPSRQYNVMFLHGGHDITHLKLVHVLRRIAKRYKFQIESIIREPGMILIPSTYARVARNVNRLRKKSILIAMIQDPKDFMIHNRIVNGAEDALDAIRNIVPNVQMKSISSITSTNEVLAQEIAEVFDFIVVGNRYEESLIALAWKFDLSLCDILSLELPPLTAAFNDDSFIDVRGGIDNSSLATVSSINITDQVHMTTLKDRKDWNRIEKYLDSDVFQQQYSYDHQLHQIANKRLDTLIGVARQGKFYSALERYNAKMQMLRILCPLNDSNTENQRCDRIKSPKCRELCIHETCATHWNAMMGTYPFKPATNDLSTLHHSVKFIVKLMNIVFIKGVKVAGSTFSGNIRRIAARYGLSGWMDANFISQEPGVWANHGSFIKMRDKILSLKKATFVTTIVRNPVEMAMSWFYYFNASITHNVSTEAKFEFFREFRMNHQYTYLAPSLPDVHLQGRHDPMDEIFGLYDFIAVTDRYNESLVLLANKLRLSLCDILYLRSKDSTVRNISHIEYEDEDNDVKMFLANEFKQKNELDFELFRRANANLDASIQRIGKSKFKMAVRIFERKLDMALQHCSLSATPTKYELEDAGLCYWHDNGCGYRCLDKICDSNPTEYHVLFPFT